MEDFEIRDTMNRATIPDVDVEFKYIKLGGTAENRLYRIHPVITNLGIQVVNNFKLDFIVPRPVAVEGQQLAHPLENVLITLDSKNDYVISYQSKRVLFPLEPRNIGEEILFPYRTNGEIIGELRTRELNGQTPRVDWTLYADNMPPKRGSVLFRRLHDY